MKRLTAILRLTPFCLVIFYCGYIWYAVQRGAGPVDFDTFRSIGARWLAGQEVYISGSFYPMPMVYVFAVLAALPRGLALVIWLGAPALFAVSIAGPWALLFAPLAAHVTGGQSALFALIGIWGFRKYKDNPAGGAFLALTLLKPQLALFPLGWAVWRWIRDGLLIQSSIKRIMLRQAAAFMATALVLYLPSLILDPSWPVRWLAAPRPVFERALAGTLPRLLVDVPGFWLWAALLGGVVIWLTWDGTFDTFILAGDIVNPFLHDYDLITLIPVIRSKLRWVALLASLPGWAVLILDYRSDSAWAAYAVIGAVLMLARRKFS